MCLVDFYGFETGRLSGHTLAETEDVIDPCKTVSVTVLLVRLTIPLGV